MLSLGTLKHTLWAQWHKTYRWYYFEETPPNIVSLGSVPLHNGHFIDGLSRRVFITSALLARIASEMDREDENGSYINGDFTILGKLALTYPFYLY